METVASKRLVSRFVLGSDAEPLMRRALAIDEQSYGGFHPNVALKLWCLAVLLRDTNRLGETQLLMQRAKATYEQFAVGNGFEHPHWVNFENYYRQMRNAADGE